MPDGAFKLEQRLVELAPIEGLDQSAPGTYTTLYVLPYQVSHSSILSDPQAMQSLITEYLTSGVDMYLQEITEPAPIEQFGLQRLGVDTGVDIVPGIKGVRSRVLRWDDALPAGLISSRMIADKLNRLWGRNTVLAIAVAAYNRSITAKDETRKELLERAEAFLRAELMDAGADEPLVAELDELLQQIRQAQKP